MEAQDVSTFCENNLRGCELGHRLASTYQAVCVPPPDILRLIQSRISSTFPSDMGIDIDHSLAGAWGRYKATHDLLLRDASMRFDPARVSQRFCYFELMKIAKENKRNSRFLAHCVKA